MEHVLFDRPGAIAEEVYDFNHDGRPDIMVMMAQAREGIYIFYNQGNGEFSAPVPVVEHHPAWGSTFFELVDFNPTWRIRVGFAGVCWDFGVYRPRSLHYKHSTGAAVRR